MSFLLWLLSAAAPAMALYFLPSRRLPVAAVLTFVVLLFLLGPVFKGE